MKLTIHCTLTHTEYTTHRNHLHQALDALAPLIHQAITGQQPSPPDTTLDAILRQLLHSSDPTGLVRPQSANR